ncbi:AAA family ATPase [Photobacterium carnosum]|nr:AAA family ATPase [Photobacterium carnosum]
MKIKKVKIQAFKSYFKEEDSTFDFSWNKDKSQVAKIVTIFAPNGFGKTSFYDAVDYCYTSNITRYIRDDKTRIQNKKNAKKQNFIIRNRNKENQIAKLDTKVVIETEDNKEIISKIIKYNTKGIDYKFDDSNTPDERKYFRDLLLSQDAIDAFLRETNPADRFNKFATKQVNSLSQLNEKRISISQVVSDIESNVREIKKCIKEKKRNSTYLI